VRQAAIPTIKMSRITIERRRLARDLDFLGLVRRSSEPFVVLTIGACSALFSISGLILHREIKGLTSSVMTTINTIGRSRLAISEARFFASSMDR
jgi:hypothetical protein